MLDLQEQFDLTYIVISHDLGLVRQVADRIGVMYLGKLVEQSPNEDLYANPVHPYTEALLAAAPIPDLDAAARPRIVLQGDPPSSTRPPSGCRFHTRCRYATDICSEQEPPLVEHRPGHLAACHHPLNATASPGRGE
jgi:oligopeptide/dipeptide ABC transporter ATP-binding protein